MRELYSWGGLTVGSPSAPSSLLVQIIAPGLISVQFVAPVVRLVTSKPSDVGT